MQGPDLTSIVLLVVIPLAGMDVLLHRLGWSVQVPATSALRSRAFCTSQVTGLAS